MVLDVTPITDANVDVMQPAYASFCPVAESDYAWPETPVDFETLKLLLSKELMRGYTIVDYNTQQCVGFLLYQIETFGALEIKVIYLESGTPIKPTLDVLFNRFLEDIKALPGWDVLSFPVLGPRQEAYMDYLTWYGLTPVGQSVVKFHLFDGITVEIMKKQQLAELPDGYRLSAWEEQYEEGVCDVLTEAFSDSVDALWDPRFRTKEGIKEAMTFVKSGAYGMFRPSCNTILLNADNTPVGVCLLNIVSPMEGNIPLIGLLKSERRHQLGKRLLAESLNRCIDEVINKQIGVQCVSATVATENFPALKMYRHLGFQEDHWYPHVYEERDDVMKRKPGQWC